MATTSCITVANTGFPFDQLVLVAAGCLAAGLLLVLLGRRNRHRRAVGVIALLILAVGASMVAGEPAATAGGCAPSIGSQSALMIVQTSSNIGLAPTVPSAGIAGRVTNLGNEAVFVDSVTVGIVAIVKAPHASPGTCRASDYALTRPLMNVDRTLKPGESVDFSGAAIGFRSTARNQDACQRAIVELRFTSSG